MPVLGQITYSGKIGLKTKNTKYQWLACVDCGREQWIRIIKDNPEHIRCHCCANRITSGTKHGEKANNWRGGVTVHRHYLSVRLYPDNLFFPMMQRREYVYKHRLIMAKHLNRCLLEWEIVHHKNGIRDDNRLENLLLVTRQEHMKIHRNKMEQEV